MPSHERAESDAEPGAFDSRNSLSRAGYFDYGCALTAKEVEQQLSRQSGEEDGRRSSMCSDNLARSHPFEVESDDAQTPCKEPRRETDIAPQRVVQCGGVRPGRKTVCSADIFVMYEELVQVRDAAHPSEAKEPRRGTRSNHRQ
jgi:hypothetical protein